MNPDIARREFLAGTAGLMAAMATGGCASMTSPSARPLPTFAYVGSYTSKGRNGRGEGRSSVRPSRCAWISRCITSKVV